MKWIIDYRERIKTIPIDTDYKLDEMYRLSNDLNEDIRRLLSLENKTGKI